MEENIHIDEDWKRRAQEEKDQLARQFKDKERERDKDAGKRGGGGGAGGGGGRPMETASGASLPALIQSLAAQAAMFLGLTPDPMTGGARADLGQARFVIDLLEILAEKTKGNLAPEEEKMLTDTLHDLRMAFVEVSQPRRREPGPMPPKHGPRPGQQDLF